MKFKKLISLICTLCMVSTYAFVPSFGSNAVMASATTGAANYYNSSMSATPVNVWGATLTEGTTTYTVASSTTGYDVGIDLKGIGSSNNIGSSATYGMLHVGWNLVNPSGGRINIELQTDKGKIGWLDWTSWGTESTRSLRDTRSGGLSAKIDPTNFRFDWFIDLKTAEYKLYIDGAFFSSGTVNASNTIKNLYFKAQWADFSYSVVNPVYRVYDYNANLNMTDVVAHSFAETTGSDNVIWTVNGIGNIGSTDGYRHVGNVDWISSGDDPVYDGNNFIVGAHGTDSGLGFRLRKDSANSTNLTNGCLLPDTENDNVIHQSLDIVPTFSSSGYAGIGFRGSNAQLKNKFIFGPNNGFVSGTSYHFDILVNNKDKEYWILVGGEKRANGYVGNDYLGAITYLVGTENDKLTISNIVTKSYNCNVSMDSLLATLVDSSTNYNWTFDGIDTYGTSIASTYGTPGGAVDFSGTNSSGYVVTSTSLPSNGNGARLGYRLGNGNQVALPRDDSQTNIIHQHLTFTPTFASGNVEYIGIRGNNGYHDLLQISAANGFTSGQTYDMHIIIDNGSFSYMFIVDGAIKMTGNVAKARSPLWEISYKMESIGDSMRLKNITTKYYKNTVTAYSLSSAYASTNEAFMNYRFQTTSSGTLEAEIEQAPCFNTSKWYVRTSKRYFSSEKAIEPNAENKAGMNNDPNWTLNLSFTANKAGTNTYYLWVRHTASVIKQDGRKFYYVIDTPTSNNEPIEGFYTAEREAPRWMCLGSVTLAYDQDGIVKVREIQKSYVGWDKYVITTDSSFTPTDAWYGLGPQSSSRAKNMGKLSSGKLTFEAESVGYGGNFERLGYFDTTYGSSSNYSGSAALKVSSDYHPDTVPAKWNDSTGSIDAGDIEFNFIPETDGSVYLWVRYYATSTSKRFAISVNSNAYTTVTMEKAESKEWQRIAIIDNVMADVPVNIRIVNMVGGYVLDKFAVSNNYFDTPSGETPNWSTTSTTLSGGSPAVAVSALPAHPRLYFTASEISAIQAAAAVNVNDTARSKVADFVAAGMKSDFTGEIPTAPGQLTNKDWSVAVARIESLAYDYKINGNAASGAKAASALINYITHVSYTGVEQSEYNGKAGYDLYALSKAYDWCYDCLTSAQKTAFVNAGIKIAAQLQTGWPPSYSSPYTGFDSEGSFQSYLLAFAIAVANERSDIYNYVMDKMEKYYVPAMIDLYNGSPMQGSRYGTYRGQQAFSAALMMKTIGYSNKTLTNALNNNASYNIDSLYSALGNTMLHYIYARRPDGLLFIEGDDTNNGKTAYNYSTVGHVRSVFLHAVKLFGTEYGVGNNSYFKEAAKWAWRSNTNFANFDNTYGQESYLSPATVLILNKDVGYETNSSLPLSRFFDGSVSSTIARTGWTNFTTSNFNNLDPNDNTAVAYMKVGQKNAGNHQHLDAGNFQLYYKGILANDPCYYNGSNYDSDYMNGYAKRSVAHNVVLIEDGVQNSVGGLSYADRGQMAVGDKTTSLEKTASWEAHAVAGDDVNQPDFTYMKANLYKAYRSTQSGSYKRSFMFMNMDDKNEPAALVVFDRITTGTAYNTYWLLHGLKSPTVSGKRAVFTTDTGGQMTNDTLLPASVSISTYADGRADSSHNYSSGYTTEEGKVNESDGYRIEVKPSSKSTTTYFLNVIQAGDTGVTAVTPTLIDTTNFYGVRLKDRIVMFSKDGGEFGGTKDQEYSFNISSSDGYVYKFAMADAATGSYEIYYSANGSSYSLLAYAKTTDDASHLLTFSGKAGYYKVVRKSDTKGGDTISSATSNTLKQLSPAVKITQSGSNYTIWASAKTYKSYAQPDSTSYTNKVVLAAYDSTGKVLGVKLVDFTGIDREADYVSIVTLNSAPTGKVTVKSMIFDGIGTINPLTKSGTVDFLN